MKLRRITAIAAIAAALAATTAAVYPRPPADRLQPMPALTAKALAARYSADAHQIAVAAAAARRAGNTALVSSLAAMRGHQFLDFNPRGPGLAVEVFGSLASASRVAILVPGSDVLTTFDSVAPPPAAGPRPSRRRRTGWTPELTSRSSPGWATRPRARSAWP
jgi:hypothetical protein